MVLAWPHRLHDDPHAVPGLPVLLLALLAVVVADPVRVLLQPPPSEQGQKEGIVVCSTTPQLSSLNIPVLGTSLFELIHVHVRFLDELAAEEFHGVLRRETDACGK